MLEIGTLVDGKYKILNKMGQGGMSVVYLAMNEKANKQWAIKEVRKDGVLNFEAVKQGLLAEIDMLKRLSHSNLPSIVDVIEDDSTILIVMDYIQGIPLSKALDEYGVQPQENVIEWAKQLCDVLGYLHTRTPAIIYRDMKPSNVMLKPDGNITLIDFGTAREFKEKNLADTTCLGTIGYAAPEQFGGMGQTDGRTDIYCLGATLYHLVTGQNPCEPPYEIRPIREINPSLSSGLERIILKCTQRNPDDRYQSSAELMYDLNHYEMIDDQYKKKQKGKLNKFILSILLAIIFFFTGVFGSVMKQKTQNDNYSVKIDEAQKVSDYDIKVQLLLESINIKPEETLAYEMLINTFRDNDKTFKNGNIREVEILNQYLTKNEPELSKNNDEYAILCFNVGKLYWYYYNKDPQDDTDENKATRMTSAIPWFKEALNQNSSSFQYTKMAEVYKNIGEFYRDIQTKTVEANDKGEYGNFWISLSKLMDSMSDDDDEIVKLELNELARNAMMRYATKFKIDGVSKEDMMRVYNIIENNINKIGTTTDTTDAIKQQILSLMDDTKKAIEIAYNT